MFNDGEVRIGTSIDTSGFEKDAKILKKEAEQVDREVSQSLTKTTKIGNSLSSSLGKVTKKIVGLGSALFDVVAVGGLLGAMGTGAFILYKALEKANGKTEQLKANLSYIGFVASKIFENLLQPAIDKTTGAINGLVGALYKMVVYVGYILSAWTGKDLFAGTGVEDYAKSMEDANKSAKSTAKSTKQIKKDLMSFDEVNKLSDNTSANVGGTGTKVTLPNLPNLGEVPIPGWVKWIAENKDKIIEVAKWVLAILTFSKVVSWLEPLGNFFGLFTGGKLLSGLGEVAKTIGTKLFGGIKSIFSFIGANIGTIATIGAYVGSIAMIGYSIYDLVKGNIKQAKQINKMTKQGLEYAKEDAQNFKNMNEMQDMLNYKRKYSNELLDKSNTISAWITGTSDDLLENMYGMVEQQDEYLQYQLEQYRLGNLTKEEEDELKLILMDQVGYLTDIGDRLDAQGKDSEKIRDYGAQYRDILKEMGIELNHLPNPFQEYQESIERAKKNAGNMVKDVAQTIARQEFIMKIKADPSGAGQALEKLVTSFGKTLTAPLKAFGLSALADNMMAQIRKYASAMTGIKLARGGIIHNPGAGVSLGSNIIGGEGRNAEAVLPLDDRTMDRLGQSIARHMTINATMINQMNGRTLSREVKQIMNESNFTYNL